MYKALSGGLQEQGTPCVQVSVPAKKDVTAFLKLLAPSKGGRLAGRRGTDSLLLFVKGTKQGGFALSPCVATGAIQYSPVAVLRIACC